MKTVIWAAVCPSANHIAYDDGNFQEVNKKISIIETVMQYGVFRGNSGQNIPVIIL